MAGRAEWFGPLGSTAAALYDRWASSGLLRNLHFLPEAVRREYTSLRRGEHGKSVELLGTKWGKGLSCFESAETADARGRKRYRRDTEHAEDAQSQDLPCHQRGKRLEGKNGDARE